MTDNQATRALRAAVFTALAVPLSALGQVVITGRPLPLSLVAAATAAVFLVALAASGTQRRLLHICAVLMPVELLLNTAFNLGQDACAAPSHGVDLLVCGGGSVDGSFLATSAPGTAQALVLMVHVLLALAAALWLRLGDAALCGLAEALRALGGLVTAPYRALLLSSPLPSCPATLTPVPDAEQAPPRRADVVLSPAPRRGPPALALAC
ncbi:hypothetical protein GCM10010193_12790 [Kitasatospora atroaurantiaca]|uniref:Uncharacterized protein n=1 Tax=Kitasatospora atroaurantiaca TaxID=285545 RepID=A0A561F024_9ACTN|nr:hypothetical protein [Kitasatospora atroaurantiaca]TWE21162.1 hypothetical protein FB465_6329 [Kitasatospora atroaurantiaca]